MRADPAPQLACCSHSASASSGGAAPVPARASYAHCSVVTTSTSSTPCSRALSAHTQLLHSEQAHTPRACVPRAGARMPHAGPRICHHCRRNNYSQRNCDLEGVRWQVVVVWWCPGPASDAELRCCDPAAGGRRASLQATVWEHGGPFRQRGTHAVQQALMGSCVAVRQ